MSTSTASVSVVSPLDIEDWDAQIASLSGATVFHSAAWARTLIESYGHQPVYLLWSSPNGFNGVCPIIESKSILGRLRGVTLSSADACQPLRAEPGPAVGEMVESALALGRDRRWQWYQISASSSLLKTTPSTEFFSHTLDLAKTEDTLFARLTSPARRGVRRAKEAGVSVKFLTGASAAKQYYELHCLTRRRHGLPPQPPCFFDAIGRNLLDGNRGFVALACKGGEPAAAAVFLNFGKHSIYKFSATVDSLRGCYPGNLLVWESIRRLASSGSSRLDFGRTSLVNEGLRRFKQAWGTVEQRLATYRFLLPTGAIIPVRDAAHGWHTRILRLAPPLALRWLGRALYPFQACACLGMGLAF